MTYRRVLLGRWSRRDRLAVLVVAVGVAFLCGTALLVLIAGDQTTTLAADYGATATITTHPSVEAAAAAAPSGAAVLPFAVVTGPEGAEQTVLARPATDGDAIEAEFLLGDGAGVSLGGIRDAQTHTLSGTRASVTVTANPRSRSSPLPDGWYLTDRDTVDRLGPSGAFVVHPVPADSVPDTGVPFRAALAFFVFGTREALTALVTVVAGSAVLIGVVVYSVTRMTIHDRRETIRVVRATGGQSWSVLGLFAARAGLLTLTGSALGYALGVIGVNAAVNAAVFLGLPTSLSPTVTPAVAGVLAAIVGSVVALGVVSGILAALPTVRRAPFQAGDRTPAEPAGSRLRALVTPAILDPRAVVPTAATLTTFVAFAVLVAAMGGVVGPLSGGGGATITEPGAVHPIASNIPETYADALRSQGIAASPEILAFESRDGQPFTVRGANYTAFSSITATTLVEGRQPTTRDEAVIGADLARTLEVGVGDHVTLGGTTRRAVDRVDIVGVYRAPGVYDDQLLVSLQTAGHLAGKSPGRVQFIRAARLPANAVANDSTRVVDVSAPETVAVGETVQASVTVENRRDRDVTTAVSISFGSQTTERSVTLPAGSTQSIAVEFTANTTGPVALQAGGITQTVRVGSTSGAGTLAIGPLPDRGPPNATIAVRVRDEAGTAVANATVNAGDTTVQTNADGVAYVPTGAPGMRTITASSENQTGQAQLAVIRGAPRQPIVQLAVAPDSPDLFTPTTVSVTLSNPWNQTLSELPVTLLSAGQTTDQSVTLAPAGQQTLRRDIGRQPPGTYEAAVQVDGTLLASEQFRVRGDERVAAALAAGGREGTSGIGRALETAFGNLQLVLGVVFGLAAALTIGGTTATFARAVHARRPTIGVYRATGAAPTQILRLVFVDALRIGAGATMLAVPAGLAGLQLAAALGYLTVFGVRISPTASPALLGGVTLAGIGLTLIGAMLATGSLLRASPTALIRDQQPTNAQDGDER
ncbi:FtsX-like permease family protein [Halobaculum limi]|uniref:FtsX-like permease family protein n=1 Tax=Halobaculum limi TaxID=3031916 RepID=UPI002405CC7C|nr:FtsX-like permease family protein [Halobaculum sp. YSMS11]